MPLGVYRLGQVRGGPNENAKPMSPMRHPVRFSVYSRQGAEVRAASSLRPTGSRFSEEYLESLKTSTTRLSTLAQQRLHTRRSAAWSALASTAPSTSSSASGGRSKRGNICCSRRGVGVKAPAREAARGQAQGDGWLSPAAARLGRCLRAARVFQGKQPHLVLVDHELRHGMWAVRGACSRSTLHPSQDRFFNSNGGWQAATQEGGRAGEETTAQVRRPGFCLTTTSMR